MKTKLVTMMTCLLVLVTLPVSAHHSFFAEFNADKALRLEGTVIEMEWVNPHSWLNIDVVNEAGEVERWKIEGGSPSVLLRMGWTRDALPPGTKIIVNGFQAKDGALRAASRSIEFPDGRVLELGGSRR